MSFDFYQQINNLTHWTFNIQVLVTNNINDLGKKSLSEVNRCNLGVFVQSDVELSEPLSVTSFSSQADGGGPAHHWSRLSQGLPESPPPLDRPDAVRGDVSDYQHLHLLRRILQQARGHVSNGGSCLGREGETAR